MSIFVDENCATSCFTFFAITFDSVTLKDPTVLHLKKFCIINRLVFIKNVSFCMISMLKSEKYGELQNFVSDFRVEFSKRVQEFGAVRIKNINHFVVKTALIV